MPRGLECVKSGEAKKRRKMQGGEVEEGEESDKQRADRGKSTRLGGAAEPLTGRRLIQTGRMTPQGLVWGRWKSGKGYESFPSGFL